MTGDQKLYYKYLLFICHGERDDLSSAIVHIWRDWGHMPNPQRIAYNKLSSEERNQVLLKVLLTITDQELTTTVHQGDVLELAGKRYLVNEEPTKDRFDNPVLNLGRVSAEPIEYKFSEEARNDDSTKTI